MVYISGNFAHGDRTARCSRSVLERRLLERSSACNRVVPRCGVSFRRSHPPRGLRCDGRFGRFDQQLSASSTDAAQRKPK